MTLIIGDVRQEMKKNLSALIQEIREERHDKPNYYIFVGAKIPDVRHSIIKQGIVIMEERPQVQLGTILVYIDNEKGTWRLEWCFPLDAVKPDFALENSDGYSELIFQSLQTPDAINKVDDKIIKRG